MGSLFTSQVGVCLLEVFIPSILESTLHRVTEEGRAPTGKDAAKALGTINLSPCFKIALVKRRVDLAARFDEIKRRYSGMSETLSRETDISQDVPLEGKYKEYKGLD